VLHKQRSPVARETVLLTMLDPDPITFFISATKRSTPSTLRQISVKMNITPSGGGTQKFQQIIPSASNSYGNRNLYSQLGELGHVGGKIEGDRGNWSR
jgi:hypothetical protein